MSRDQSVMLYLVTSASSLTAFMIGKTLWKINLGMILSSTTSVETSEFVFHLMKNRFWLRAKKSYQ